MLVRRRDHNTDEEGEPTRVLFKVVFVFDRAQVAPIDGVPQVAWEPPCER